MPRSWALLRSQQAGGVHVASTTSAGHTLAGHALVATRPGSLPQVATSKLQVATPNFNKLGRDLKSMSRPAFSPPIETPLSRPKTLVPTPNHHKAARTMLRHQIDVATSLRPLQVATSKRGRDTVSPAQPQARSQHQNQVATLLETNLCRDINFMSLPRFFPTVGFLGRDTKNPVRDLQSNWLKSQVVQAETYYNPARSRRHFLVVTSCPTKPGRDLKSMSRPQTGPNPQRPLFFFLVVTQPSSTQLSQVTTPISGHDLKLLLNAFNLSQPKNPGCNALNTKPGRDLTLMSRLQITQPMSQREIHLTTNDSPLPTSACHDLKTRS